MRSVWVTTREIGTVRGAARGPHFSLAIISVTVQLRIQVFWVISVYFNVRNILPKSGTFPPEHPVYVLIYFFVLYGGPAFVTCAASQLCWHYGFKQTGAWLTSVLPTGPQPKRCFSSAPYCVRHRSFGRNVQLKEISFYYGHVFFPSSRRNLLLCAACCKWLMPSRITEATQF